MKYKKNIVYKVLSPIRNGNGLPGNLQIKDQTYWITSLALWLKP